ncbi:MAG TPA: carbonic anhydrase [Candidatus Krumholzibacterium sp.]|nr:carbonic anhydrase [Candidatus Krumholzibacterium sp.]
MDGEKVLSTLLNGNRRFVEGAVEAPRRDRSRRVETAGGQSPVAIVLCCSDSRVVPELIFDQGIGDLFVVRVAGNVVDDVVLGSIEYAAAHLSTPLLLVMGHTGCGAVNATVAGGEAEGHTGSFIEEIRPSMEGCGSCEPDDVARESVRATVRRLSVSEPVLGPIAARGGLVVRGAFYDTGSGEVTLLDTPVSV